MKNYEAGKKTIVCAIPEGTEYKKAKDFLGDYEKGSMKVLGYIKTHSVLYDKDQYSLFVDYEGNKILLNVPAWYGSKLEADFEKSGQTAEEFFDTSVKSIVTFATKFNNESVNILVY